MEVLLKSWFDKLPYPVAGVMLALATLGNVFGGSLFTPLKVICGVLAGFIAILLILKTVIRPKALTEALGQLQIASVLATFPMGLMILATYLQPMMAKRAFLIWSIGLFLHAALILYFSIKHLRPIKINKIFASYYVTYVGIVVASVTSTVFGERQVGFYAFLFGLVAYGVLFPLISYRYMKLKEIPMPARPLIIIYGAPANLLVVGYLSLGLDWSNWFISFLWVLGALSTVFAWYHLVKLRKLPFYPSYASFTFPLVIGAFATLNFYKALLARDIIILPLKYFGHVQTAIGALALIYVLFAYTQAMFKKES